MIIDNAIQYFLLRYLIIMCFYFLQVDQTCPLWPNPIKQYFSESLDLNANDENDLHLAICFITKIIISKHLSNWTKCFLFSITYIDTVIVIFLAHYVWHWHFSQCVILSHFRHGKQISVAWSSDVKTAGQLELSILCHVMSPIANYSSPCVTVYHVIHLYDAHWHFL